MNDDPNLTFPQSVAAQIALLNAGKPLEAFDASFAENGVMYANGKLFAKGAAAARAKQEPYISAAQSITGDIQDLALNEDAQLCAFRNRSSFTDTGEKTHQIDGLCWQKWENGRIIEEQYFDGAAMNDLLTKGLLDNLEILTPMSGAKQQSES